MFHIVLAGLIVVGLIFLNVAGLLAPVLDSGRLGSDFLGAPLVRTFQKTENFPRFFWQLRDLNAQNRLLTGQVEKLTAELAGLEKAGQENRVLREALGFAAKAKLDLIPAEVITWEELSTSQTVTLNRGADHGVTAGDTVIVSGGVLVGLITEVLSDTSQMEVITSSSMAVSAEVVPGNASGVVRGEHGLGLLFDLVSQTDVVKEGDRVLTSGLGGRFPPGLLVGQISKIRSGPSELFQKAAVLPATDLRNLSVVFVVKK